MNNKGYLIRYVPFMMEEYNDFYVRSYGFEKEEYYNDEQEFFARVHFLEKNEYDFEPYDGVEIVGKFECELKPIKE